MRILTYHQTTFKTSATSLRQFGKGPQEIPSVFTIFLAFLTARRKERVTVDVHGKEEKLSGGREKVGSAAEVQQRAMV